MKNIIIETKNVMKIIYLQIKNCKNLKLIKKLKL